MDGGIQLPFLIHSMETDSLLLILIHEGVQPRPPGQSSNIYFDGTFRSFERYCCPELKLEKIFHL